MRISQDEEIVRIGISKGAYRSTVSMDMYLANALKKKVGGDANMIAWVQKKVEQIEKEIQEKVADAGIGDRVKSKSGLSRLIQREAFKEVLGE